MKKDKEVEKEPKKEEFFSNEELEKIKKNKEQSNMKWLWLVLILIIMLVGVYGSYWYFSKERIAFQKETTKEEKKETSKTETSVPEEKKEETETIKETEESTKKVYVSGSEGLNLRSEPNTEASIVIGMPHGAELEVLEESEDGLWYKVKYEESTGWCYKEYTSETKPES